MHEGLRAKQTWNYRVYAVNEHGHSATASDKRNATTADAEDPTAPGNLLVKQENGSETVNLYWTKPDDGGQNVVRYRVEVSDKDELLAEYPHSLSCPDDAMETRSSDSSANADPGDPNMPLAKVAIIHVTAAAVPDTITLLSANSWNLQHVVTVDDQRHDAVLPRENGDERGC